MNSKQVIKNIFLAGVESVRPDTLVSNCMHCKHDWVYFNDLQVSLERIENIYVIGAGKACALMAVRVEEILGNRITGGHIVVRYGYSKRMKYISVSEAGHPLPDQNGILATAHILEIVRNAGPKDLVICLLSGGGSALLPDLPDGSTLEELIVMNDLLVKSGADIREINAVRKHLSSIKGGQLARAVYPATLVTLILSDVPGDPPDVIASGPTAPDPTTFQDAMNILMKYELIPLVPENIIDHLRKGIHGEADETPKPGEPVFNHVHNIITGNNRIALEAARREAVKYHLSAEIVTDRLQGDSVEIAEFIMQKSLEVRNNPAVTKPVCLLFGGETTVKVKGNGLGGRNQHLALLCALKLRDHPGITVLCAGTDGTDGPTDAAGALVDSTTYEKGLLQNANPVKYLDTFDSYLFFKKTGGHIMTGPTKTNVMDMMLVIIE
jgi:glycerate 2-kinase